MHRVVPTHVARHNLVGGAPVLNIVRKRVVIGVGGGFGCVCNQKKKQKTVFWMQCKNTGNMYQNDYFTVLMFGTKHVLGYVWDFKHRFGKLNIGIITESLPNETWGFQGTVLLTSGFQMCYKDVNFLLSVINYTDPGSRYCIKSK